MAYYRICSYCGANIDPGEICDCRADTEKRGHPVAPGTTSGKIPNVSLSAARPEVKAPKRYRYG